MPRGIRFDGHKTAVMIKRKVWAFQLHRLRRELWERQLPHGLMGWRYLVPSQDARIGRHRSLWWQGGERWPRGLWLLVQLWLWLRWVLWLGWRSSWRVVPRLGPQVQQQHQLSFAQQLMRTLRLSLGWCIAPQDVYRFGLYLRPQAALNYVYDHESSAYHAWRSRPLGLKPDSLRCIQNKLALAERLRGVGVPMVDTYQQIQSCATTTLARALGVAGTAFCKMNSGNRGRGAFSVWRTPEGLVGQRFTGQVLPDTASVEAAWQHLLTLDEALIQPLLTNHPALAGMTDANCEAITVRFITEWHATGLSCLSATLEVPSGKTPQGATLYGILPVVAQSGLLEPFPSSGGMPDTHHQTTVQLLSRAPTDHIVPHWTELSSASFTAHRQFPDVCAIAWDWVITPQGPVLLEGNTGWGTTMPQLCLGGFLGPVVTRTWSSQ